MKKIIKFFTAFVITLSLSMFINTKSVDAATGSISISGYSNVTVGNTVSVTISGYGSKIFYWQLYVSYDSSKLQLISGSTTIQGEADDATNGTGSFSQTLKFKTLSVGTGKISVAMGNAAMNIDSNFGYISYSSTSKNIYIVAPVELSSNNYLTGLTIDGATLSPEFNRDTLDYKIELAPDTTNIVVNTVKEDSLSSVSVSGNVAVVDGVNNIPIVVTAENGATRTYNLVATVKEYDPIEVEYEGAKYTVVRKKANLKAPTNYTETTVKIKDIDVPALTSEITKYILVGLKDAAGNIALYVYDSTKSTYKLYKEIVFKSLTIYPMELDKKDIPKNYERTTITYNEQIITAYKLDKDSKYALIYGMNLETGKINVYMYDSVENTVQIYNNEELVTLNKTNDLYFKLIIGLGVLSSLLFISLIIVIIKKSKNNKKEHKKESKLENKNEELLDDISESKESKINNLLFDEEETRSEKNMDLADTKELKRLAKQTKKEEIKKAKEDKILEKKKLKEEKKNKNKVKVTKIKFDDEGSL